MFQREKTRLGFGALTTGIDNFNASGNAIFEANIGTIGNTLASTFTPFDKLTGSAGIDTLNIFADVTEDASINGAFPVGAKVSGIEIVNIFNQGDIAANLTDASKFEGVEQLWQYGLAQSVTKVGDNTAVGFGGVTNMTAALADDAEDVATVFANFTGTQATIALDEVPTADGVQHEGDDQAFRLGIEGSKVTTVTIVGSLDNETSSSTAGYTGYGRLQLASEGGLAKLETVNLALTTDTNLATYGALTESLLNVKTFNGADSTGGLDLGLAGAATNNTAFETITTGSGKDRVALQLGANSTDLTVSLGDGDDRMTLAEGSVLTSSKITIDGGEGTDTLEVDGTLAIKLYDTKSKTTITGFETLKINDLAEGTNAAKLTGYETIIVAGAASGGSLVNLADDASVRFDGDLGENATLTMQDATGTSDTINLTFRGVDDDKNLTVAGVETVNIESSGATSTAVNDLNLVVAAAKTLTITGANALTLGDDSNFTKVTSVDSTDLTAALTIDLSSADQGVEVTLGSKASTVVGSGFADIIIGGAGNDDLAGGAGNDTIVGGRGNDNIEGGTGADLLTGGAGVDVFVQGEDASVAATTATGGFAEAGALDGNATITFANGVDVITDFLAGNDQILPAGVLIDQEDGSIYVTATNNDAIEVGSVFAVQGTWNEATNKFSYVTAGSDVLLVNGATTADDGGFIDSIGANGVILLGVGGNLTASDFVIA